MSGLPVGANTPYDRRCLPTLAPTSHCPLRRWLVNSVTPESRYACCPWMAEYEISRWACTVNRVAPSSVYDEVNGCDHTRKRGRARRDQFDLLPPSIRFPADEGEWFELEARPTHGNCQYRAAGPYRSGPVEPPL